MKVYVIQLNNSFCDVGDVSHVIAVRTTLASAQNFVHGREGEILQWEHHNAHGQAWCAYFDYRINQGPRIRNNWTIEEFELRDE